jgi:hypothetical protein
MFGYLTSLRAPGGRGNTFGPDRAAIRAFIGARLAACWQWCEGGCHSQDADASHLPATTAVELAMKRASSVGRLQCADVVSW